MSHIFRSDAPHVGDRVVVRRKFHTPTVTYSDVTGHVLSTNPLVIRPQEVGGYPSSREAIEIPAEHIHIIKKLSPRTIRNSDIRAIEIATAAAFPGREQTWTADGQWLMRAGDGITERSNSAAPLGPSAGLTPVPLAEITEFYQRHQLPVQLLLPERLGRAATRIIDDSWELGPEIIIMTRELAGLAPPPASEWTFAVSAQPHQDWLDLYHFRGQALPAAALHDLRQRIDGQMGFGSLRDAAGQTVAITRGTLTGPQQEWLGFSAVEVAHTHRRRGLGTLLGQHMLHWGAAQGASAAYLQVLGSNAAGINLYRKLGFSEHHRHRYARLQEATPGQ